MKRVMIIGLIGISLFSLVGCNESSKEVIIEKREGEDKIVLERISTEAVESYYPNSYLNGEYYFVKGVRENVTSREFKYEDRLYKLNRNNEFEKTDKENSFRSRNHAISPIINEKDSQPTKAYYFDNTTGEKKTIDLKLDKSINLQYEVSVDLVEGEKKVAYTESLDLEDKNFLTLIDIETNKFKRVDKSFEGNISSVIYEDGYYILSSSFKLYKLKEEEKSFKIEEEIDLMKEFNIKPHDDSFYIDRVFLKGDGEIYIEGRDNNREKKHTDSCAQALFRYNLKTKEKGRIDYNFKRDMIISDYNVKSGHIALESLIDIDSRRLNGGIYIGKVNNDKVEIIEEVNMESGEDSLSNVWALFNEEGDELMVQYLREKNGLYIHENLKIKIK